jgi:hypothetical protein
MKDDLNNEAKGKKACRFMTLGACGDRRSNNQKKEIPIKQCIFCQLSGIQKAIREKNDLEAGLHIAGLHRIITIEIEPKDKDARMLLDEIEDQDIKVD